MADISDRLLYLFRGLDRAFGVSTPTGRVDARGKVGSRYVTKRDPISKTDWDGHLSGKFGLVPIPIRDDGTVCFGAIDIDIYPLDFAPILEKIQRYELPLIVCRTKSGGAHIFLFLKEPYSAERVQAVLMNWSLVLGFPGCEVFPKQISLSSELDVGLGVGAPYRGGEDSMEYALRSDGDALSLADFLDAAELSAVDGDSLRELDEPSGDDDLKGAPPCLQHWASIGIPDGQRNDTMFDFAVFAKKKWPNDWQSRFEEFNRKYCHPPLPASDVLGTIKSVGSAKTYMYKSKCQGPYCVPALCRTQEHGRGGGYDDPGVIIDGLVIVSTSPKTYIVSVNGRRMEMTSDCLTNQRKFQTTAMEALDMLIRPLKPAAWIRLVEKLLAEAEFEEAPEDARPRGQLIIHLRNFIDQYSSEDKDRLLLGQPWRDRDRRRICFRSQDLAEYLTRIRVTGHKISDLYAMLRELGGDSEMTRVKHTTFRMWWIPNSSHPEPEQIPLPEGDPGSNITGPMA